MTTCLFINDPAVPVRLGERVVLGPLDSYLALKPRISSTGVYIHALCSIPERSVRSCATRACVASERESEVRHHSAGERE